MTRQITDKKQLSHPSIDLSKDQRDEYFRLLELHNQNRIDYNVRKWETIKFGQTLSGVLLAAAIAAYLSAVQWGLFEKDGGVKWLIATLFFGMTACCVVTLQNLKRESARLFEEECMMFKLARFLELDVQLQTEARWIPNDSTLLFCKWTDCKHKIDGDGNFESFADWVDKRTEAHQFLQGYGVLFAIFAFIGLSWAVFTIVTH